MTIKEMKKILLSKKGITPEERKRIEKANDYDIKDLFSEFKRKIHPRFTDNFL